MGKEIGENIDFIFSPLAYALKKAGYPQITLMENKEDFIGLWEENKILPISRETFMENKYRIEPNVKYALYGAGATANYLYDQFEEQNIICVADSDCNKWGTEFHGHRIMSPDELFQKRGDFDKVFIASNFFFEIKTKLLKIGFEEQTIVSTLVVI